MNNPRNNPTGTSARHWSSVAIAGVSVFIGIILVLHVIHPEFDPSKRFMSEYVLGNYGWLLNIACLGNLIGSIALTIAVYLAYPPPVRSWICIICLGIAAISVLTNFFPTDLHGKAVTVSGHIHNLGAFGGTLAILVVMLVLSIRLHVLGLLQGFYRMLLLLAILAPIVFLTMLIIVDRIPGLVGIAQRIYVAIILTWMIVISYGIRSGVITPGQK
jgi:hypothetical protein